MAYTILFRRGTDNEWQAANPTLRLGELGFVTDTKRFKIGDGLTDWNSLQYSVATLENGKIPLDQLPDYVKVTTHQVSTIAQRNGLSVQPGDFAVVAEEYRSYISTGYGGSASWVELLTTPDLTGIATESYVDNSISALDIPAYITSANASALVASEIDSLDLEQYATYLYVDNEIDSLNLPPDGLYQIADTDSSIILGLHNPAIGTSASTNRYYRNTTGLGINIFPSASAFINLHPNASAAYESTVIGTNSMSAAIHNFENIAVGFAAIIGGGFRNIAIGNQSLHNISPSDEDSRFSPQATKDNTAVGHKTLFNLSTGYDNTVLGYEGLLNSTSASGNIAIGKQALRLTQDGSNNNYSNSVGIGNDVRVPAPGVIKLGNTDQIVVTDNPLYRYSDSRDISSVPLSSSAALPFINNLDPVVITYNSRNEYDAEQQYGFVASDVHSVNPLFPGYKDFSSNGSDIKAISYDQFIPPIVGAIQQVDARLVAAESDLFEVDVLSASVAALSASVNNLVSGDVYYYTYDISSSGESYIWSGSAQAMPTVTLIKGRRYRFNLSNVNSSRPLAFRESDGVTNEVEGMTGNNPVSGISGSSTSNFVFYSVPENPSYSSIIYQSVANEAYYGVINLVDS